MQGPEQAGGGGGGALRGGAGPRARHGGHRAHRARHEVRGGRRNHPRVSITLLPITVIRKCVVAVNLPLTDSML